MKRGTSAGKENHVRFRGLSSRRWWSSRENCENFGGRWQLHRSSILTVYYFLNGRLREIKGYKVEMARIIWELERGVWSGLHWVLQFIPHLNEFREDAPTQAHEPTIKEAGLFALPLFRFLGSMAGGPGPRAQSKELPITCQLESSMANLLQNIFCYIILVLID